MIPHALRAAILAAIVVQPSAVQPIDVTGLTVGPVHVVCQIDLNQIKGEVRRLSWSPQGTSLHLQTVEHTALHDYIVTIEDGVVSLAFGEPEWASQYWAMKSDLSAPGLPDVRIDVTQSSRRTRPMPFTGGFANGGAQTLDPKNPVDAYESEVTLYVWGREIGNWLNGVPTAGETFGWGPPGSGAIAFVDHARRVTLLDRERRTAVVASTKGALFPAWSIDGGRVAFLERTGRRSYRLMIATVSAAPR